MMSRVRLRSASPLALIALAILCALFPLVSGQGCGGSLVGGFDPCDDLGYYGDGVCDDFCADPDPDCDADADDTGPVTSEDGLYTVFTDPNEPLLLAATASTGEQLGLIGERDEEGIPTKVTALVMQSPDQFGTAAATTVAFDDSQRVSRIVAADGTVIELTWQSDTMVLVSAVTGDGEVQVNTVVDLGSSSGQDAPPPAGSQDGTPSRIGLPIDVVVRDGPPTPMPAGQELGPGPGNVKIHVTQCGEPASQDVRVLAWIENPYEKWITGYKTASPAGSAGEYVTTLPTVVHEPVEITGEKLSNMCKSFTEVAGNLCETAAIGQGYEPVVCLQLGIAVDVALLGPTGESLGITAACEAGLGALSLWCQTVNQGGGPGLPFTDVPGTAPKDFICEKVKEFRDLAFIATAKEVTIQASAHVPGKPAVLSEKKLAPETGPMPDLNIDLGSAPEILQASTSPADPAPGQGYTVTVEVSCAFGQNAIIEVSGSDGYSARQEKAFASNSGTLELYVPGGAASVQDTISVVLGTGDARTIVVSF